MKYLSFNILILIMFGTLFSCKKGGEDPFLSLKSRKARISGDWILKNFEVVSNSNDTIDMVGDQYLLFKYNYGDHIYNINKDGTWSSHEEYEMTFEEQNNTHKYTLISDFVTDKSGTWSFIGKVKGVYKNKERILFSTLKWDETSLLKEFNTIPNDTTQPATFQTPNKTFNQVETYSNSPHDIIYDIIMLKSKEMKWTYILGTTRNQTYTNSQGEIGNYTDATFSKSILDWTAK